MNTYLIGHIKPDTDAVVAPMALAELFHKQECFGYSDAEVVITDPLNPETGFLFEKFGIVAPRLVTLEEIKPEDRVILVDHNEENQRLPGLNPDQIVEIIDHHKLNCNLKNPIYLTCKPWGSSTTIAYYLMKQNNVVPDQKLASLMLAAILSDTVGFKSATTVSQDRELGAELAKLAEIADVEGFTLEIFKAKSDLSSLSPEEMVTNDYKIFEFSQKTMIGQLETVEQNELLAGKKTELLSAMATVREKLGVSLIFLAITDILQVNTKLLILSEKEQVIAEKAFGGTTDANILDIGAKMSRKKEIAPPIETALN
ncbi:MAG: manganese-dependent inorganic pyrophosphatase [Candidatus Pacebacteria bacterium CG_4_10_14_0_8_um_filter_42_14]|nr:MAG: manganese-dependent inorganic pyrophosphatase [Candidatus Pacebacteria bacterium CG_4_10_14_0_8_um_filter_42_14]